MKTSLAFSLAALAASAATLAASPTPAPRPAIVATVPAQPICSQPVDGGHAAVRALLADCRAETLAAIGSAINRADYAFALALFAKVDRLAVLSARLDVLSGPGSASPMAAETVRPAAFPPSLPVHTFTVIGRRLATATP